MITREEIDKCLARIRASNPTELRKRVHAKRGEIMELFAGLESKMKTMRVDLDIDNATANEMAIAFDAFCAFHDVMEQAIDKVHAVVMDDSLPAQ